MTDLDVKSGNLGRELVDLHVSLVKSSGRLLPRKHTPIVFRTLGYFLLRNLEDSFPCALSVV